MEFCKLNLIWYLNPGRRMRITYFFMVSFFLLILQPLLGQSPFSSSVDSIIQAGIEATLHHQYDQAESLFVKLEKMYPEHPAGIFYRAATLQSKLMDYETTEWGGEFEARIGKAIRLGEQALQKNPKDPWLYFYTGNAYLYNGLYLGKTSRLVSGFLYAHKGIKYLEKAVQLYPLLYDAYLGIGSYKYWAGRFYKYLNWLPGIQDERELGIQMIHSAIEKSRFSQWVGINTLGWIEFDRKQYAKAMELFSKGLEHFPKSRFFLWGMADCAFGMEDYPLAIQWYSELLESLLDANQKNGYNEAECRLKRMMAYKAMGNQKAAKEEAEAILAIKPEKHILSRIEHHYRMAKQCLKEIQQP